MYSAVEPSLWSSNWSRWGNIHCWAVGGNKEDRDQKPQVVMSVTRSAGRTSHCLLPKSLLDMLERWKHKGRCWITSQRQQRQRQINWNSCDHRECSWIKLQWLSWGSTQITRCAIHVRCQLSFHSKTKPHIPLLCTAMVMESCSNLEIPKFFLEV